MALLVSYQYAYTQPYHPDSRNHGQLFCPRFGSSTWHSDYNPAVMTWGHVNRCPSLSIPLVQIGTVTLSNFFNLATNRMNYYYSWLQMYCCWSCRFLPAWRLQHLHLWPALQKRQMETSWAGFSSMVEQQCWGIFSITITHLPTWLLTSTPITSYLANFRVKEY